MSAIEAMDLAVIESRWWDEGNDSVRSKFDMLAAIHTGNPFNYHYEMFSSSESFVGILRRVAEKNDIHHVYIAHLALIFAPTLRLLRLTSAPGAFRAIFFPTSAPICFA